MAYFLIFSQKKGTNKIKTVNNSKRPRGIKKSTKPFYQRCLFLAKNLTSSSLKKCLKNKTTLKRKFKYLVRELDLEYYNTSIVYQTLIDNLSYTFSLDVPTMFYDKNPNFYDSLILNVSFLYGKDNVNKYLNKKEN